MEARRGRPDPRRRRRRRKGARGLSALEEVAVRRRAMPRRRTSPRTERCRTTSSTCFTGSCAILFDQRHPASCRRGCVDTRWRGRAFALHEQTSARRRWHAPTAACARDDERERARLADGQWSSTDPMTPKPEPPRSSALRAAPNRWHATAGRCSRRRVRQATGPESSAIVGGGRRPLAHAARRPTSGPSTTRDRHRGRRSRMRLQLRSRTRSTEEVPSPAWIEGAPLDARRRIPARQSSRRIRHQRAVAQRVDPAASRVREAFACPYDAELMPLIDGRSSAP